MEPDTYREALLAAVLDHPDVWEYVGSGRYLQAAFSRSTAHLYASKFDTFTSKKLSSFAAKSGSQSFVAWTKEIVCDWTKDVFISAIEGGYIPCMEFVLYTEDSPAIERGDIRMFETAAEAGNVAVLEWLRVRRFEWCERICCHAATRGHLKSLIWLLDHGCSSTYVALLAAHRGHLNIIKWMHANNYPIEADASAGAAQGEQLHILEWLHEIGGSFSASTFAIAAATGRLDTVKWLRAHGCPWNADAISFARGFGHTAVVEWCLANGCPEPVEGEELLVLVFVQE